jgi:hypothetical protein
MGGVKAIGRRVKIKKRLINEQKDVPLNANGLKVSKKQTRRTICT